MPNNIMNEVEEIIRSTQSTQSEIFRSMIRFGLVNRHSFVKGTPSLLMCKDRRCFQLEADPIHWTTGEAEEVEKVDKELGIAST